MRVEIGAKQQTLIQTNYILVLNTPHLSHHLALSATNNALNWALDVTG